MRLIISAIFGLLGALAFTLASLGLMFITFVITDNIDVALGVFLAAMLGSVMVSSWLAKSMREER